LHCYGDLLAKSKSQFVGIVAAQILGEPLTQTIMRTFHSGGSASLKTINLIDNISNLMTKDEKSYFVKNFYQEDIKLFSRVDNKIFIYKDIYEERDSMIIDKDKVQLQYGYFEIVTVDGIKIDITIDNPIEIPLETNQIIRNDNEQVIIQNSKNSVVFECPLVSSVFSQYVELIKGTLSGKTHWKNTDHYCMKVFDLYKSLTQCDLVHIEVLVSNLIRDKGNPSYPARLNRHYNPTIGNIKNIPPLESWLSSLEFEQFNKSINTGLLYDRPKSETILEKIVTGNF